MSISIFTSPQSHAQFVRCSDVLTFEEMVTQVSRFLDDPVDNATMRCVVDLSPVVDFDLTFADIQRFLPYLQRLARSNAATLDLALVSPRAAARAISMVFQILTRRDPNITVTAHRTVPAAIRAVGMSRRDLTDRVWLDAS
jgi:hypothetical protein